MAATVQIWEMTSNTEGVNKTDGTVRFKSADETSVDSANRVQIPATDNTTYSYTKQLRAYISVAPSVDLTNLRAYTDGGAFSAAVGVQYDTQQTFQTQTDANISGSSLFGATSGAPVDMDQTNNTSGKTDTGNYGDHLRCQLVVEDDAAPGALTPETLTFAYDET